MDSPPATAHRIIASALWAVATTLLISATVRDVCSLFAWGVFSALVACVSTGWLVVESIVRREQEEISERVARAVARVLAERDLPRVSR